MNNQEYVQKDTGLSSFFANIYAYLTIGMLLTAGSAYGLLYSNLEIAVAIRRLVYATNYFYYVLIIAEIGLAVFLSHNALKAKSNPVLSIVGFVVYSVINGLTLAVIFAIYTSQSIATAFLTTAAMFIVMSVIGFVTKKNLSGLGQALRSALIGIIVALLLNTFILRSSGADLLLSIIIVLVFSGLIAYDTQKSKAIYENYGGEVSTQSLAILCALQLYLDFVNIFLALLRIFGNRR